LFFVFFAKLVATIAGWRVLRKLTKIKNNQVAYYFAKLADMMIAGGGGILSKLTKILNNQVIFFSLSLYNGWRRRDIK
jgi:hypothetical protein